MKRVLQITIGEAFRGAEKLELEWLRNIRNNVKFDFLETNDKVFGLYLEEIKELGGNVYNLNVNYIGFKNKMIYFHRLRNFLKRNNYDIIHINSSAFFFSLGAAIIAKICQKSKM